jgi:hypothetical protein
MTNMNDLQTIVDHAAVQNDRWLFLALLVLTIIGTVFFWRWLTGDREKLANRLTEITDRHIASQEKVVEVVANNTLAMRDNNVTMRETQAAMRDVQEAIVHCRDRDRDRC